MTYSLLSGLRVLEIGSMLSAPYCGKLLADAGARVVKLESPEAGDPSRRYGPWPSDIPHPERSGLFLYLNSNKEGITANLGTPDRAQHHAPFGRRVRRSWFTTLPPADMERLGLDYDALAADNPNLVMASISPWGLSGPWRDYKAYDINLAAAGGICEGLGEADREPLTFRYAGSGVLCRHGRRILHRHGLARPRDPRAASTLTSPRPKPWPASTMGRRR